MKTLLKNGKIYVERGAFCEALLIEDGIIKAIGTSEELLADDVTEVIDCEGRTVVPGFNDSHMHLMQFSEFIAGVRIDDATSIDMIVDRCREYIAEHPGRTKNGLQAMGWNQDLFEGDKRMPNRHDLDRITTDIPVVLERVCGHISAANTKAIEQMIAESGGVVPEIEDGDIYLDDAGYPTGVFTEAAVYKVTNMIPKYTMEERRKLMLEGMRYAACRGYTSLQSNDLGCSSLEGGDAFKLMKDIAASGEMPLRYRHQCAFYSLEEFEESLRSGEYAVADKEYDPAGGMLTLGPLKLFADGSLGARTALLTNDYADEPGNRGLVWASPEDLKEYVRVANEHGVQVITHSIGDQATKNVLDAYEAADPSGTNPCRNVVNHCQITDREILGRIRDGNILTAVQPIFLEYDLHMAEDRVGPELASTSYAFGTMKKSDIHSSFGTDAPVEDLNPFANIYSAVTRKDLDGEPAGGWNPSECMDVYDAVDCATIESAYMEFAEDIKGRLKPGYLADLVILDKDIFTCPSDEIKDILPVMTMVGGKIGESN